MKKDDVAGLLSLLQRENERANAKGPLAQRMRPAEPLPKKVPTLEGSGRPLSPMLRARFMFGGRWKNAVLGQTWLSAGDMANVKKTAPSRREVALRRESWPRSPVAKLPLEQLSLFAVDADEGDATYLVWGKGPEPKVVEYAGASETVHRDLATYLRARLGAATKLEGSDAPPADTEAIAAYLADEKRRLDVWVGGLERWGQPALARAALAAARLVLPTLPAPQRKTAESLLAIAQRWADQPRGELPESFSYMIVRARPIDPKIEGKQVWNAMHACCEAAHACSGYHLERPRVIYADDVRAMLLGLRKKKPPEVAAALDAAGLKSPAGARWSPSTAKNALERFSSALESSRDAAMATVTHVVDALGKSAAPKVRKAVRAALR
jgi:hypothetical protein